MVSPEFSYSPRIPRIPYILDPREGSGYPVTRIPVFGNSHHRDCQEFYERSLMWSLGLPILRVLGDVFHDGLSTLGVRVMSGFYCRNREKYVSVAAVVMASVGLIACHVIAERGSRTHTQPARGVRSATRPTTRPTTRSVDPRSTQLRGIFSNGKMTLKVETIAMVPDGAKYAGVSSDLSRLACYYVKEYKAVPFICGENGAPGGPDYLPKNVTRPRATSRPTTAPGPYGATTRPSSSYRRYRPTSGPTSRPASDMPYVSRTESAYCIFSANARHHVFLVGLDSNLGKLWRLGRTLTNARILWKGRRTRTYAELTGVGISPDGAHYSCIARDSQKGWLAVMDGREVPLAGLTGVAVKKPGSNGESPLCPEVYFSPDRTKFVYIPRLQSGFSARVAYLNEKLIASANVVSKVTWSRDSRRYGYIIADANEGGFRVVVDGKKSAVYRSVLTQSFVFSNDGRQYAFVASGDAPPRRGYDYTLERGDQFVVHNGVAGKHYSVIGSAYDFEGSVGSSGMGLPGIDFSVKGGAVYLGVTIGDRDARGQRDVKYAMIADGREQPAGMREKWVAFSADRKHSVYVGAPGSTTPSTQPARRLSPMESRMLQYRLSRRSVLIHDGREGPTFTGSLGYPVISPDGLHAAAWLAHGSFRGRGTRMSLVVDEIAIPTNFRTGPRIKLNYVNATTLHASFGVYNNPSLFKLTLAPAE